MNRHSQQRQDTIRTLLNSDSLTLEHARAILLDLLDVTASAQTGPDVTSYGRGGCLSSEVVDAEYQGREQVGDDVDDTMLDRLQLLLGNVNAS
ncbi:hypothetical protein [Streptomyces nigrescens]|uniref:hypothetical protein n=1 Tax=Streptomyces nigrescens TaxID=1920 RepID=UPI003701DC88